MADFFQNLFDEWNGKTISLQFELDYKGNKDDIKTNVEKAIKDAYEKKKVYDVDLQSLADKYAGIDASKLGSSPDENLYKTLADDAARYNISVRELIPMLAEQGAVLSDLSEEKEKSYSFAPLINSESESLKNLTSELDTITSAYKSVQGVISDYNKTGILSISNLQTIIKLGGDYAVNLVDENGKLSLNEDAYKKLAEAKLNKLKIDVINNALDNVSKLSDEAAAVAYLKDKTDELCKSEKDAARATLANTLADKFAKGGDTKKAAQLIQTQTEHMLNLIDATAQGLATNASYTLGSSEATDAYTTSLEANNKVLEKQKSSLEAQKSSIDKVKESLEDEAKTLQEDQSNINSLIDQTVTLIKHEQDALKEKFQTEIDGLKESNDAYQDKIDNLQAEIDLEAQQIKNQEELADKRRTLTDIDKELSMLSGDNSSVAKNRRNELLSQRGDAQKDLNKTEGDQTREKRKAALDEVAEQHQKETDALTKALEERIKGVEDYLSLEGDLRRDAMKRIDSDSHALYGQLLNYNLTYTSTSREEFDHMWSQAITALEKYDYAHYGTFAVMAMLQTNIYKVNDRIAQTEVQIKGVQSAIDGIAGAIDNNSRALSDYTDRLNEAAKAKESFNKLNNFDSVGPRGYSAIINGTEYTAQAPDKKSAVQDILDFFLTQSGLPKNPTNKDYYKRIIEGSIHAYASGTRKYGKEIALTGEKGYELILDQPAQGRYAPLNNATVFNAKQTDSLWDFSKNPYNFIQNGYKDFIGKFPDIKNNSAGIQISAPITVNGNATREGVEALSRKLETDLFPKMTKSIINEMVKVGKSRFR